MNPDDFAQTGTVYTDEPSIVRLEDGLVGTIERNDGPICGVQDRERRYGVGPTWTCILPPGHECAHLRAGDEFLEVEGPIRVTRLQSAGKGTP